MKVQRFLGTCGVPNRYSMVSGSSARRCGGSLVPVPVGADMWICHWFVNGCPVWVFDDNVDVELVFKKGAASGMASDMAWVLPPLDTRFPSVDKHW